MTGYDDYIEQVKKWRDFYETIEIRSMAVDVEEEWINLRTDVFFSAESLSSNDAPDPILVADYGIFHDIQPATAFDDLVTEIATNSFEVCGRNIQFASWENEESWKERFRTETNGVELSSGEPWLSDNLDDWSTGLLITRYGEKFAPTIGEDRFKEVQTRLKRESDPYRSLNDLSAELFHPFSGYDKTEIRIIAPKYVELENFEIEDEQKVVVSYKSHREIPIDGHVISLVLEFNKSIHRNQIIINSEKNDIVDVGFFNRFQYELSLDEFDISEEVDKAWLYLYHEQHELEPIEASTYVGRPPSQVRNPRKAILDAYGGEDHANLRESLTDPDAKGAAPFADKWEYATAMLFKLSGFSVFLPEEEFSVLPEFGKSCDVMAVTPSNEIIVCECTCSPTPREVNQKDKIGNAYDAVTELKDLLDGHVSVVPAVATPYRVESELDIEHANKWGVAILDKPVLSDLLDLMEDGVNAHEVMNRVASERTEPYDLVV